MNDALDARTFAAITIMVRNYDAIAPRKPAQPRRRTGTRRPRVVPARKPRK